MKKTVITAWTILFAATVVQAQGALADEQEAERARIAAERKAAQARYEQERKTCYQKFAVQDCLDDIRRRYRVQTEDLKRREAALNHAERQRRGAEALEKQQQRAVPESAPAAPSNEPVGQAQQERDPRAAGRAAKESDAARKRRSFDAKQTQHTQQEAQRLQTASQAEQERARYEAKQERANREREAAQRRMSQRTKPRAAPLPEPPSEPKNGS